MSQSAKPGAFRARDRGDVELGTAPAGLGEHAERADDAAIDTSLAAWGWAAATARSIGRISSRLRDVDESHWRPS